MNLIVTIFWGLLLLCLVVFIHEAGHFIVARLQGVRVTEFFLGMPCRWRLARRSKRYGTLYGVTPILLGGYNQICGLAGEMPAHADEVLACLMERGRATPEEIGEATGLDSEAVLDILVALTDCAAVEPFYDPEKGERPSQSTYPEAFQTVDRDARLLTRYDKGNDFSLPGATRAGEPQVQGMPPDEFLEREESHTYLGNGFWGRVSMLIAGVAVNIVFGILIVVVALMTAGISVTDLSQSTIGSIDEGSLAQSLGLQAGDEVLSVDGVEPDDWEGLSSALHDALASSEPFPIVISRDGVQSTIEVPAAHGQLLGISAPTTQMRLNFFEAVAYTFNYLGLVGTMILRLLQPAHVQEVIQSSTSIIGITVMAGEAAAQGIVPYVLIAASVSISLGFVNLLPIPPLDGGKILIEIIQAIARRPLPKRALAAFNYVGIGLFLLLFFVLFQQDIFRFVIR